MRPCDGTSDHPPHVGLLSMTAPLAFVGAGQSMLFAGLFRSALADARHRRLNHQP